MEYSKVKYLSLDEAQNIGKIMKDAKNNEAPITRDTALNFLMDIKQDMLDREMFETLTGFKQLEDWHKLDIPFVVLP